MRCEVAAVEREPAIERRIDACDRAPTEET